MIKRVLKSKFLGALVGTGVGDALGAPFEGRYRVKLENRLYLKELAGKLWELKTTA